MKLDKRVAAAFLVLAMLLGLASPVLAYNHGKAQEYADRYVLNPNRSQYQVFSEDCANFVSQCLFAGGLSKTGTWYSYLVETPSYLSTGIVSASNRSSAWVNADALKNYLKNTLGATLIGRWWYKPTGPNSNGITHYCYRGANNSNNIQGLGSEVIFYDWTGDGKMDHASIVVGTNYPYADQYGKYTTMDYSRYGALIDQHTTNRRHQIWNLEKVNQYASITGIYAFRLK